MKLSEFDFQLPDELIATKLAEPRDHARLLILEKETERINHHTFYEIIDYLNPGDVLVWNSSKVFPARLFGKREDTEGKIELLLNKKISDLEWEVIGKNLKVGIKIVFDRSDLKAEVTSRSDKIYYIKFNKAGDDFFNEIDKIGITPLPPYIKRDQTSQDKIDYQTVYAKEIGSAAAPTAGLHFTEELIQKIKEKGITIAEVTLHVGLGTFSPVKTEEIEDHQIHSEYYSAKKQEIEKIIEAKKLGNKVVAVGTTSARVLESLCRFNEKLESKDYSGFTDIFIYPGYKFKCVDSLITNFHLPKSTLLMLVSALAGQKNILNAYQAAIAENYKFFSYGDAMLIK